MAQPHYRAAAAPHTPAQANMPRFSFPSPDRIPTQPEAFRDGVGFVKMTLQRCDPAVVRQAVREMWEITLVGSEYHTNFICSTMLHRASADVLGRAIEAHGRNIVKFAATQVAGHFQPKDLDLVAPILLPKLSMEFLDKALALRLESIQAQRLVNALGRAERLGYDVRDVVTGDAAPSGPRQERVIPSVNPIPAPQPDMRGPSHQAVQQVLSPGAPPSRPFPNGEEITRLGIAFCNRCNRPCGGRKALAAHLRYGRCGAPPPPLWKFGKDTCILCGQHFTAATGLRYHISNKVCGEYPDETLDALRRIFEDADEVFQKSRAGQTTSTNQTAGQTTSANQTAQQAVQPTAIVAASQTPEMQQPQSPKDPYAMLTPEKRRQFDEEMARAEAHFGAQMKKALELPAAEQSAEIARLKNGFHNKQSMTRKKYGIRLRERRTRAEIEDERTRMLGSGRSTPASTGKRTRQASEGTSISAGGRDSPSRQGTPPKRMLLSELGGGGGLSVSPGAGEFEDPTAKYTASPVNGVTAAATTRPMPMSIAGSLTAPVRASGGTTSTNGTADGTVIKVDEGAQNGQSNTEMELDESSKDEAENGQSNTEMDVDESSDDSE